MADGQSAAIVALTGDTPLHPLVAAVMTQNPSIETLRELMALQREHVADLAKRAYTSAITEMKRELPTVIDKDREVDFKNKNGTRTNYWHASLAAVMGAVTAPLAKHGFSLSWHPKIENNMVYVTCRLTHAAGHFEETMLWGPIDTSGNKSDVQGVMSTVTLLSRYTAMSILGLATRDMHEPTGDGRDEQEQAPQRTKIAEECLTFVPLAKTAADLKAVGEKAKKLSANERAEVKAAADKRWEQIKPKPIADNSKQPAAGIG